jgi:Protein of unknown function (DUF3102)
LQQGNSAGHEHYRCAGEMLIEAKDQVGHGAWGRWLTKNFELSGRTAQVYMRWAREQKRTAGAELPYRSLREMRGDTERERDHRQSTQHQAFRRVLHEVSRVIEIGRLLLTARAELDHGEFTGMVNGELPFKIRTAQRLMAIAEDERSRSPPALCFRRLRLAIVHAFPQMFFSAASDNILITIDVVSAAAQATPWPI